MSSRTVALRNLERARAITDPRRAALGRGRIQLAVALQFAVNGWRPTVAAVVMHQAFWELEHYGQKPNPSHYQRVRRAFERFAVRTERLKTRGRPWLWAPKPEIMNHPGGPDEWWERHLHPFRKDWWDDGGGVMIPHPKAREVKDLTPKQPQNTPHARAHLKKSAASFRGGKYRVNAVFQIRG